VLSSEDRQRYSRQMILPEIGEAAHKAGEPIVQKDATDLTAYMEALAEAANATAPQATEPERELVAA